MNIVNAVPSNLALWLVAFAVVVAYIGIALWCTKTNFWGADRTFLKLDKYLRKKGMMGLFTFLQVFIMSIVILFGIVQTFLLLALRFGF